MALQPGSLEPYRTVLSRALPVVMEALVLVLIVLSPWAFGAVDRYCESWLLTGVAGLLVLWAARVLVERQWCWRWCPVALCLAGLFLISVLQCVPVSRPVLAWLSPATARFYEEFLPVTPEILPGAAPPVPIAYPAGAALSLYPAGTRSGCLRLLAVFLLYAVVRNNSASTAALRRLSIAVMVNGALLALFALVQCFSSPPTTVYWNYSGGGSAFGPFLCRNHFPFYLNIGFGLGVGLLTATWPERDRPPADSRFLPGILAVPPRVLASPWTLWICCGLALMLTSILFSLSRGGVLALLGATAVCLVLYVLKFGRASRLEGALLVLCLALALGSWFGLERVQNRLATLLSGSALAESRLLSWRQVLPATLSFPLWGTGLGTYPFIERMHKGPDDRESLFWEHAHNDYLEALVEGGIIRLALSLLAIGFVYRVGYRAAFAGADRERRALALGALFGFTTVVIHSAGDFGLHIPAIAVLATVLTAQLAACAEPPPDWHGPESTPWACLSGRSLRLCGPYAPVAAAALLGLGFVLYREAEREERAERFRLAARHLDDSADPASRQRQREYLEAAVALRPDDAELHLDYAEALQDGAQEPAALAHILAARDLCPLLVEPPMKLAALRDNLVRAEPRQVYLARARRLHPADAEVWFIAGIQELADGRPDEAWSSWRQSLQRSPTHLVEIVRRSRLRLQAADIAAHVLPDDPPLLLAAAALFDRPEERRPILEKSLVVLARRPGPPPAEDLHQKAVACRLLERPGDALLAYRAALAQAPKQLDWRCELVEILLQQGKLLEARAELLAVLGVQSNHARAQSLMKTVDQELAAKKSN